MALQHHKPFLQNSPQQPSCPCLTSTSRKKIRRGNGNQEFESHLGDTEPGPCCHQWLKVTSASHNIFAPPSLSLKQTNPIPKKSRSLPAGENHSARGRGIWVKVSFQSPRLGHTVPSSHGFRVTWTRSSLSRIFPCGFPDRRLGKRKAERQGRGNKEQEWSSLRVLCCPRSPAPAFQEPAGKQRVFLGVMRSQLFPNYHSKIPAGAQKGEEGRGSGG